MKRVLVAMVAALAAGTMTTGCAGEDVENDGPAELALDGDGKADVSLNGLVVQTFGGPLQYGESKVGTIKSGGSFGWNNRYKVGYTFRAKKNAPVTISVFGENGEKADTIAWVYRQKANGKFDYLFVRDAYNQTEKFTFKAPADGIYLLVSSAKKKQNIVSSIGCGNGGDTSACELYCAINRLYRPQCGVDGNTYSNPGAAACYAVPVAYEGHCPVKEGEYCDDLAKCDAGLFCASPADAVCAEFGTCTKKPQACITLYKPVCGCDGQTHGNACSAAAAGVNVAKDGACVCESTDYEATQAELAAVWRNEGGASYSYPTEYSFALDGSFTFRELISPCPAGVTCVWSGIKTTTGKYKINGPVVGLWFAGNTSDDYDQKLLVKQDCNGALFVRAGGPEDTDYTKQ